MTISQNLFRRHRGARGETTDDAHHTVDSSPTNTQEVPGSSHDEASITVSNNEHEEATSAVIISSDNITDVENPLTEESTTNNNNHSTSNNTNSSSIQENDDEIQELVIRTNNTDYSSNEPTIQFPNWTLNEEEIQTRRETIRTEIERMQRSNFIHFVVLCLVPTSLLLIVIAAILSEDGECGVEEGGMTSCEREPRKFVNAFTTRCICEAVGSVLMKVEEDGEDP